jgi:K+-sensing histidine kinase KdpD
MRGRLFKLLLIIAAIALVLISWGITQHVREQHKAAEREAYYQTVLAKYTSDLKPGMSREEVEQRLQANGKRFSQMCCVANFRGEHTNLVGSSWDDLVKIGEEMAPWFCSENNVWVAFEFNPKSQSERPETNSSDILKRVSVFHQLEDCL